VTARPCGEGWYLHLLGGFQLGCGDKRVALGRVEEALVAFLVLQGRPVLREQVAAALWPEADGTHGAASLRTTVWRVRRQAPGLVTVGRSRVGLEDVALDLAHARDLVARATTSGGDGSPEADPGTDTAWLEHDLLPDWTDEWIAIERERFRQGRLHALEAICRHLTAVGRHARAIDVATASIAADPLRESAHRVLIEAHLAEGNRSEALRQFERFARVLDEELGLRPTPALAALVGRGRPPPDGPHTRALDPAGADRRHGSHRTGRRAAQPAPT
jgi:DNA-binding SARP family transcriptional activator